MIKVVMHQTMPGGEPALNVFHFFGTLEDEAAAEALRDHVVAFYEAIDGVLVNRWHGVSIDIGEVGIGTQFSYAIEGLVGEVNTGPAPNDCCMLVHWRTAAPGRSGRGRTFLGGWPTNEISTTSSTGPAVWAGDICPQVATAAAALVTDAPVANPLVIAHSVGGSSVVIGGYVSNLIATQRRRDRETPESRFPLVV